MGRSGFHVVCLLLLLGHVAAAEPPDWLVQKIATNTSLQETPRGSIILTNGLIAREFTFKPGFYTSDLYSLEKEASLLRALNPEAVISLDRHVYRVGGILTNITRGYLNRTALAEDQHPDYDAFSFQSYHVTAPEAPYPYSPRRFAPADIVWPPTGLRLDVLFTAPESAAAIHKNVRVTISYEMYDGIPLMSKWVTIHRPTDPQTPPIQASFLTVERLAVNKPWAATDGGFRWLQVSLSVPHVATVHWHTESSQAAMAGSFQPEVFTSYDKLFSVALQDTDFVSFQVRLLMTPTHDPERVGLATRRLYRLLAPQTQENPIFFHMTKSDNASMYATIDQLAEVGFEMLIYSFHSGFNIESTNETYIQEVAQIISYANNKGIEVGGYDLIATTRAPPPQYAAIDPSTGKPSGNACFASGWYDYLLERFLSFMDKTGLSMVETDGSYVGYPCANGSHAHHHSTNDSIYWQAFHQSKFFLQLRERSVYINQPVSYFFQGASKTGMGYNENQYSLPRWQDISVSRQGMFDDTYHYTPTIGWMFVPLVVYHSGGDAAMFEPLDQHHTEYEWALAQYLGAGVAACYRGYRAYDTNETKALVTKWISFYKRYRDILISDIIHVRRADMQGIDAYMHVNPFIKNKGLAMVFNPTHTHIDFNLTVPLYYTGLTDQALISEQGANPVNYTLQRDYTVVLPVSLKPLGITWYLVQ